ncbi:MAG TPA: hypothetical protein PLG15_00260 [Candidatus Gastranaerophilaceae bacterium]|nr:hypothetical protein [Candidatus Gastranaerophilaceae bacterium]HPT40799.1 hypothetical protein [Candidatus Gastranaerophilaceae bacterium]
MNINKVQSITFGNKKASKDSFSGDEIAQGAVGGGSAAIIANGKKLTKILPKKAAQKADTVLNGAEVVLKKSNAFSRLSNRFSVTFKGAIESLGNYKLLKPVAKVAKSKIVGRVGALVGGFAAVGALAVNLATTVNVSGKLFDTNA